LKNCRIVPAIFLEEIYIFYIHDTIQNMQIVLWLFVLIASLFFVVKSADYFTEYSEKIGVLFGLSSFIIGATIVAVGTSLPELITSLFAMHAGETSFVVDNVIGSNIANALLILGITGIMAKTLSIKTSLIDVDLPFFFMSMGLFVYFGMDKIITAVEGVALFALFIIFILYNLKQKPDAVEDKDETKDFLESSHTKGGKKNHQAVLKYSGIILASMVILALASKFTIDSILKLSDLLHITSSLLTITVVALGTSLPEVLTSIAAVRRGNHGIAVGNVLGSNTFNLLFIVGLPALFKPLTINPETFTIGVPFLVFATFVTIFVIFDDKIRYWEGTAMILFYAVFIAKVLGIM